MSLIPIEQVKVRSTTEVLPSGRQRLPSWFKVNLQQGTRFKKIREILETQGLHTICEEARCPNMWECWNNQTATFLILGDICTRRCHYCSVTTGRPDTLDTEEPERVASAVKALGLRHAVITSVNRDELADGGALIFSETIRAIRRVLPTCKVEVLVPDFQGQEDSVDTVLMAGPDIFNHNIETVPRLFASIRPQGKYDRSLQVLRWAKQRGARTKSGLMVGMGETSQEVRKVLHDLRGVGCDMVSIGQYLQPTKQHHSVIQYYTPEEFQDFKRQGLSMGFRHVESGPLVRSSYHAEQQAS
ncbi:MAG: lipoyl synthase [Nitrospirota bacterium]|nr:lipoyl synthase [Nitrospirota bacterium]